MIKTLNKNWPLFAGIFSAIMLAAAHSFEFFMKLYPCALCLHQREVYWAAFGFSALAIIAKKFLKHNALDRAANALLAVIFLAGAAVAGFHAGVEQHWWKGLPECAGVTTAEISGNLLDALSKPMNVPKCDDIPWSFLGLSMAVWNMIISLFLAVTSCYFALKNETTIHNFQDFSDEI